jgi:hypothetical protein
MLAKEVLLDEEEETRWWRRTRGREIRRPGDAELQRL